MSTPDTVTAIDVMAELTDREKTELGDLRDAVYPPETESGWTGADMEWAPAHWRVAARTSDGTLASHVGILVRDGVHSGTAVTIAGIGGVKTHPRYRRQGHAARAMRRAEDFFHTRGDIDFGLLVCDPPLLDYYAALGWKQFNGRLLVTQFGARTEFTYSKIMTLPVRGTAPAGGVIDLGGPPW
ncbi:GNAT family N-acetyltransferase [Streptomyces sp. NPDC088755]|uniref:GNAT family N-acetyltransferase n=1 Tax=Streptomyces sp. NPDC088755 TaxID=3365888 RepID=UPI00382E9138